MGRSSILVRGTGADSGTVVQITPQSAGWDYIGFHAVRLAPSQTHAGHSGGDELAIVVINGTVSVGSSAGSWERVGQRPDPFSGKPEAVYLPADSSYEVRAETAAEIAVCAAPGREAHAGRLIAPGDISEHIRGKGQASRRIHNILMGEAPAGSLLLTEIQSPAGNWSSYPPHKHDRDDLPGESQLEESYYFRVRPAQGFAFMRVYSGQNSPDEHLDQTVTVHDGDVVLVPYGYHVVAAAAEYDLYYLNVLAGPKRVLAMSFDPDHEWIMKGWTW
jgi:5-deoxy-glucuronate isomerase